MADTAGGAGGLLGTLYIRLTAQTTDFVKNTADAEKKVTDSVGKMDKAANLLKGTLGALGLAFGLAQVVSFVKQTIAGADELKKFSEELGIGIDKLAGFKFAADKANVGDAFQMGMRKFASSMREAQVQGSDMAEMFQKLNIDPFAGMDKGFEQASQAFTGMEDGINKMGIAQELFGTRNSRFVNLVSGGMAGLNRETEELARVMGVSYEEAAKKSGEFNDALTTLKAAFTGLALTFINDFLPKLTEFNKNFAEEVPKWKSYASTIGTAFSMILGVLKTSFEGFMGYLKVASFAIFSAMEGFLRACRVIATGVVNIFEGLANAGIKAINFLLTSVNAMADKLPNWIKERLGISGTGVVEPIELFKLEDPKGLDGWIDTLSVARKNLLDQLAVDFKDTAKVIKDGNEEVKKAIDSGPGGKDKGFNPDQFKADKAAKEAFEKRMGDFMKQSGGGGSSVGQMGGLRSDIMGLEMEKAQLSPNADSLMPGLEMNQQALKFQQEKDLISQNLADLQTIRSDALASGFTLTDEHNKRLTEMEAMYGEKRVKLEELNSAKRNAIKKAELHFQLQTASTMFGDLAEITGTWAGKQSGIYKTMFAMSKAFAIADATVKIAQGIAAAAANPWPLNLAAIASVVAATASIVSSIQSVTMEFGGERAMGGTVSPNKAFLVGERGPEMFVPNNAGNIVPNDRLMGGGQPVRVVINNYTDATASVTEREEGGEKIVEVILRRVKNEVAGEIRQGTGPISKAMESSFALRRGR